MSSPPFLPLFFFGLILASSLSSATPTAMAAAKPAPVVFPVRKDASTNQYYTTLQVGTPATTMNAVIDIVGQFSWLDCSGYKSSSYRPIPCESSECKAAGGDGCTSCSGPARPGCTNGTCLMYGATPYMHQWAFSGLGVDVLVLHSTNGIKPTSRSIFQQFTFSCVTISFWTMPLADSSKGIVGLASKPSTLPTGLSTQLHLPRIFALCLPSSSSRSRHGDLFVGGGPYTRPPIKQDLAKLLLRTRLLIKPSSNKPVSDEFNEYFIDVTAIKVDSAPITFNHSILVINEVGEGGTKFGTLSLYNFPYTVLHTTIVNPLVREFTKKAMNRKIKKAAPVFPFMACFDAKTVKSGAAGPDVPVIVLVLRGDVKWRIEGANSMVRVTKDVMCLGFVNGGGGPGTAAIVIGGHQMEDNLVEFDVRSLKFGFSNSLLLRNSSCSHF